MFGGVALQRCPQPFLQSVKNIFFFSASSLPKWILICAPFSRWDRVFRSDAYNGAGSPADYCLLGTMVDQWP